MITREDVLALFDEAQTLPAGRERWFGSGFRVWGKKEPRQRQERAREEPRKLQNARAHGLGTVERRRLRQRRAVLETKATRPPVLPEPLELLGVKHCEGCGGRLELRPGRKTWQHLGRCAVSSLGRLASLG